MQAIERLLREAVRRKAIDELFETTDRMAAAEIPPMSEEKIQAEIDAVRKARRVRVVVDTNTIVSALLWHGSARQLIVSGDAHLLNLKSFHRMPIVTATEALARIGEANPGN